MSFIVADAGSCWAGKRQYGFEMIRVARDCGVNAVKFQLFRGEKYTKAGNLELPFELFDEFYAEGKKCGMDVTASVFDEKCLEHLILKPVPFVKFAYSMREEMRHNMMSILRLGKKVFTSQDVMSAVKIGPDPAIKKFFVYTVDGKSEYPVTVKLEFEGMFPERFQGFSDHSLGVENAKRARDAGCELFECHFTLPYSDIQVPDRAFAKEPRELARYVEALK